MKVELQTITPNIEETIVEIARVSSSRKDKKEKPEGLINYLIRHKHWSPFEHGSLTFSIETSKAIGIQLLRHRSFTFQEFSQRYSKVTSIEAIKLRKQAETNRQSSTELMGIVIPNTGESARYEILDLGDTNSTYEAESKAAQANDLVMEAVKLAQGNYEKLLDLGVARECARMILPMATSTHIYMTGTLRSWIHFIQIRNDEHAQKEIRDIAQEIQNIIAKECPIVAKALDW